MGEIYLEEIDKRDKMVFIDVHMLGNHRLNRALITIIKTHIFIDQHRNKVIETRC